jgi:hypothetical protein
MNHFARAIGSLATALAVLGAAAGARGACTWIQSVDGWDASVSWTYNHQASWSDGLGYSYEGRTSEQVSFSAELETQSVQASGPLEGAMSAVQRLDSTPPAGLPGYVDDQGGGLIRSLSPPPPQLFLTLDPQACHYTFLYGEFGTDGTGTVKSGCCTNTTEIFIEPGNLGPGLQPIPDTPQALTFSGPVPAVTNPPLSDPFYSPPSPAYDSEESLGEGQLGNANVQWSFQPRDFVQPPNDLCAAATLIGAALQDTTTATSSASDPTASCGTGDRSVWFLVHGLEGLASVSTAGSDYDTVVSVWPMAEACGALTGELACGAGQATWNAEPGHSYRVQVERSSGSSGGLVIVATVPEPGSGASSVATALAVAWLGRRASRAS